MTCSVTSADLNTRASATTSDVYLTVICANVGSTLSAVLRQARNQVLGKRSPRRFRAHEVVDRPSFDTVAEYRHIRDGSTALYIASENGHSEVVKELIAAGAKVDVQEEEGMFYDAKNVFLFMWVL
ncbi:hypothetical protein DIPPA_07195 [Diplonema papillatum]|nr:hypothetical protein DIPPA_07195 [Diplonema papillatum]